MREPILPNGNKLLAAMSADCYARLAPHLESVNLQHGEMIYAMTGPVKYMHFPTTAIISVFSDTPAGRSAEIALVGNDGALGLMAALCRVRAPFRSMVDTAGHVYSIDQRLVQTEVARGQSMHRILMRHLTARVTHLAGNAVCNSLHSVEQRLCRALLMRLERTQDSTLFMTHDMMSAVLGARRPSASLAAAALKKAGAIDYHRGTVTLIDRDRLLERACECYVAIRARIDRLMSAR